MEGRVIGNYNTTSYPVGDSNIIQSILRSMLKKSIKKDFTIIDVVEYIITGDVKEYREVLRRVVKRGDIVLEVGCGVGKTAWLVSHICKKVVGMDKSKECIKKAIERYKKDNLEFIVARAEDIGMVLRRYGRIFTVVLIDLSGNRDPYYVLEHVERYGKVFQPRIIIIKNSRLQKFIKNSIVFEKGIWYGLKKLTRPCSERD